MDLEESIELIIDIVSLYYEERDYLLYANTLVFSEKPISFDEFRGKSKKYRKLSKEEKSRLKERNSKILSSFR